MNEVISAILGVIILFPFIVTIVFMVVMREDGQSPSINPRTCRRCHDTIPISSGLYRIQTVFGQGIWVYIVGIAIIIAIVYAFIERSKVKEFQIVRLLRKTWRFYFLVLLAAYVILLITGVVMKIVEYVR